ncbi:hypothetical protein ACIQF6_28385 [Kitasatospora sp. NPDC092948]|uniref:hypothetical protein n=1 Tax=Kitasatospora sp. NPDC092948 TaxID=3364088 RepID=UPI003828BA8E
MHRSSTGPAEESAPGRRAVSTDPVPDEWVRLTVPPVPDGGRAGSWRLAVTDVDPGVQGEQALAGLRLYAGDAVACPAGTLLLVVDKRATGTDRNYRTGRSYVTEDATVTLTRVQGDGTTEVLWGPRHFAKAATALGTTVRTRVAKALAEQAPAAEPQLLEEVQRPNRRYEPRCPRCERPVAARRGHLVRPADGARFAVEHWPACPADGEMDPEPPVKRGSCAECGTRRGVVERHDSSGIPGKVCHRCDRWSEDADYLLSFA